MDIRLMIWEKHVQNYHRSHQLERSSSNGFCIVVASKGRRRNYGGGIYLSTGALASSEHVIARHVMRTTTRGMSLVLMLLGGFFAGLTLAYVVPYSI